IDIQPLQEIYFGPSFTDEDARQAISELKNQDFEFEYVDDIEERIAQLLAEGGIVARCKGRMEFGARALGNRSILADAADYSCVRIINMMVKKRDFWMPFAPVIMKERENDYIVNQKGVSAPYMILSFDTTERRKELIAAVHQADLTARPQVLERDWNPEFYTILEEFEKRTGKGVLLNTSFNLHGYPMVYGPKEALWVFENSDLRYLALGNYLLHK
ncbi:carbamoyltransferase C-terminal domain-containing protein, partial [Chloroflexota bacterium]